MGRHAARAALGCALALPAGCGDGSEPEDPVDACLALDSGTAAPAIPAVSSALRGSVRIWDERNTSVEEPGSPRLDLHRGQISASFGRTAEPGEGPPVEDLGGGCVGFVGIPDLRSRTSTALELGQLSVRGTAVGTVDVPATRPGVHRFVGAPLVGPDALEVVGAAGAFPGFSARVAPVEPMTLLAPDPRASAALGATNASVLAWTAGDGDAVTVRFTPNQPRGMEIQGGQVECRVPDQGCLVLPSAAAIFLAASRVDSYTVSVERERAGVTESEGAQVLVRVASSWRFDMAAGAIP